MVPNRTLGFSLILGMASVVAGGSAAQPVALRGEHEDPNAQFGQDVDYRLEADAAFGWRTQSFAGDIDLNGFNLVMDTGGGNTTRFRGSLRGQGTLLWSGGGEGASQRRASYLEGSAANTFVGTLALDRGVLVLNKPAGTDALRGKVRIGAAGWAELRWAASNQLAEGVSVEIVRPGPGVLNLDSSKESLGQLSVVGDGEIRLGDGGEVRFADSSGETWGKASQLLVYGGSGEQRTGVYFGDSAAGLSAEQLSRVGFVDPAGASAGLYRADLNRRGQLNPTDRVEPSDPPYDMSAKAIERRQAVYALDGLDRLRKQLRQAEQPVKVSLFGDSITWQDGYAKLIRESLKIANLASSAQFINRGINGGGVAHLRDGAAGLFDQDQPGFAKVLQSDQPDIVVIFIGVNDVSWLETSPDDFRAGLEVLVRTARESGVVPILATLTVNGEMPDGTNPLDDRLDEFARITLDVAKQAETPAIDLRSVFLAYLKNHNAQLRLDGSVTHLSQGLLTYDAIHPSAPGNRLIAEHVASAIAEVLAR